MSHSLSEDHWKCVEADLARVAERSSASPYAWLFAFGNARLHALDQAHFAEHHLDELSLEQPAERSGGWRISIFS